MAFYLLRVEPLDEDAEDGGVRVVVVERAGGALREVTTEGGAEVGGVLAEEVLVDDEGPVLGVAAHVNGDSFLEVADGSVLASED